MRSSTPPIAHQVADDLGAQTVAFPVISAGSYNWPHDDAVRTAVETLRDAESGVREARIVAFSPATLTAVQTLL